MIPPQWRKWSLLWRWKRRVKSWLETHHSRKEDHDIRSHPFMANRWGNKWKQWQTLFSLAPKSLLMVTAAMKLKDASWMKSYDQPRQLIEKQKHHFADNSPCSQSYGFSSSHGCKSWTIKKTECQRIGDFELWCWRRFLRVPWTARRSNQSILKEINLNSHWKNWCWSWSSNTLATWWEELTHLKRPWC